MRGLENWLKISMAEGQKSILELAGSMRSKKTGDIGTVEDALTLEAKEVADEGEFVDDRKRGE